MQKFMIRTFCEEYTISCSNLNAAATVEIYAGFGFANIFFDGQLESTIDPIRG